MIDKKKLIAAFEDNINLIKEAIWCVTVFPFDEPDKSDCAIIEAGLRYLVKSGNSDASAIYCFITAYDNNCETFSKEFAISSFFKDDETPKKYRDIVFEVSKDVFSEEDTNYYQNIPYIWLMSELGDSNNTVK